MNLDSILKVKSAWEKFCENHPKFPVFLNDAKGKGIPAGTMIEITLRYSDGSELKSGIKIKQSDIELLDVLKNIKQ